MTGDEAGVRGVMTIMCRAFRRALVALFLLIPAAAAAENAERISLTYDVWSGGFNSFDLEAQLDRSGDVYGIAVDARTKGFTGWLFPYALRIEARGLSEAAGPRPRQYRSDSRGPDRERRRELLYGAEGIEDYRSDGEADTEALAAMTTEYRRHTLDPASAIHAVIERLAPGRRCAGRVAVFDGRRRYDLTLENLGKRTLPPGEPGLYSGPAALCRVAIERLSGFRNRQAGRFPTQIDVWSAVIRDGAPALPVRLESHGDLGATVAHLVAARIEGAVREVRR